MRGEFYNSIHDIVSQDEAWDMILFGEDFLSELRGKYGDDYQHVHVESQKEEWKAQGISHYEGFFLRSDGMVELAE